MDDSLGSNGRFFLAGDFKSITALMQSDGRLVESSRIVRYWL